jgi:pyridoxamine 5'-phosphate oxidase
VSDPLPGVLPENPLPLVQRWLAEAEAAVKGALSMTLATVDPDGRPSARMVICRGIDVRAGWLVFYTDRESRKGRDLAALPRAALVFYWEPLGRQVRIEGPVTHAADADADRYWDTRPADARLAAVASEQSRPIASRAALLARVKEAERRHGTEPARPSRFVGYRVWAEMVELWVSQPARLHDRGAWARPLTPEAGGFRGGAWTATRLQP